MLGAGQPLGRDLDAPARPLGCPHAAVHHLERRREEAVLPRVVVEALDRVLDVRPGVGCCGQQVQRIVKGTQTMTVYKQIQPLAFGAVDAAVKLAHHETVPTTDKINNGKKDVPAILLAPIVVDKSNVDSTIIKDGYHTHQDIYGQ